MMELYLLIASLFFFGCGISGWFFGRRRSMYTASNWLRLLLALLLVAGGVLLITNIGRLQITLAQKKWPAVSGTILESKISDLRQAWPTIVYTYTVNGQEFTRSTHLHFPAFGGRTNRLDAATKVIAAYAPGEQVRVYYNPQNPSESLLKPGPTWDIFGQIGLALTFLGTSAFFLAASLAPPNHDKLFSGNNHNY